VTPAHHPSPEVLKAFAQGELRPAFVIAAGVHVRACSACQSAVDGFETDAGRALLGHAPEPLPPDSFARTFHRAQEPSVTEGDGGGPIRFGRRRWAAPGVWVRHAPREVSGSDQLYLLKAPPRFGIHHGHQGIEFTALLQGSIQDGSDFHAGDFVEMSEISEHRPAAGPDGCLCLIASEKPMRARTLAARIAQKLAGA
jgi:putative transcriptional regulator